MANSIFVETREQYDRVITSLGMEGSPTYASALDDLILLLQEAVQDQYVEAQALYEDTYGWDTSPEPFEEWLDHAFPRLADLPEWVFTRIARNGS